MQFLVSLHIPNYYYFFDKINIYLFYINKVQNKIKIKSIV